MSSQRGADPLDAVRIRAALASDIVIGRRIIVREQTTSTNDDVYELAKEAEPQGLVLFAEYQTAGRGQRGSVWHSTAGKGLLFSILLRPDIAIGHSHRLTHWAAETIRFTLESYCRRQVIVKPPNDVMVAGRKIAGVLAEMRAQAHAPHLAIIGIGVNVNDEPRDFSPELRSRAISLAMLLGARVDRTEVAIHLLRRLNASYCSGAL